jgi:hypothetical protein
MSEKKMSLDFKGLSDYSEFANLFLWVSIFYIYKREIYNILKFLIYYYYNSLQNINNNKNSKINK